MLRLDEQNSTAERYDKANKGFIQYWLRNATVSIILYKILSCHSLCT